MSGGARLIHPGVYPINVAGHPCLALPIDAGPGRLVRIDVGVATSRSFQGARLQVQILITRAQPAVWANQDKHTRIALLDFSFLLSKCIAFCLELLADILSNLAHFFRRTHRFARKLAQSHYKRLQVARFPPVT